MEAIQRSRNRTPHFGTIQGRRVFFYEGWPSLILTVEIPWLGLVHGRYRQTLGYYDFCYPAARRMGLTALKVPIKWAMVEPGRKGKYDFSYLEHAKKMAERNGLKLVVGWFGHYASGDGSIYRNMHDELFAPEYVIRDDRTYPRAVDADGRAHHNCASYACPNIVRAEVAAFRAFMRHLKKIDGKRRTVQMIQVENEIALFGVDRRNRKLWRDHRPEAEKLRKQWGFKKGGVSDLIFTARLFGEKWLDPLTRAGKEEYPIPQFLNYVSGMLAKGQVGGSPGEDIATHQKTCPAVDFIGRNLYMQPQRTVKEMRGAIREWCVGGNIPAITETNSGTDLIAPRLAFISIGEFGAPLFAPWALNISYPGPGEPYVTENGKLANGACNLRDAYEALGKAPAQVAFHAATERLKVFISEKPGESFRDTKDVGGIRVTAGGYRGGQAIVIRTGPKEILALGFRCSVSLATGCESWPGLNRIKVAQGRYRNGTAWTGEGSAKFTINQSTRRTNVSLSTPSAVRIGWR